jgi:hypothetical protein
MLATMQFRICLSSCLPKNVKFNIQKNTILPDVYGCETWSLILREEHRLRVFENRVLGRIFEPKGDDARGELRKLHNEELHSLHSLANTIGVIKSRRMRWEGHVVDEKGIQNGFHKCGKFPG